MKTNILFVVLLLIIVIIYINNYTNGLIINTLTSMPKMIAMVIAIIAIIFPRSYDKIPDILEKTYKNYKMKNEK